MKRLLGAVVAWLVIAACAAQPTPKATASTDNPSVPVALMFEVEGCKVYRFYDDWHYHYFANCPAGTSAENTVTRSTGKTHVTSADIVTWTGR